MNSSRLPHPERTERLDEISALVRAGYSHVDSIRLELHQDVTVRILRRDLQQLRELGRIRVVAGRYWVPAGKN